MLAISDRCNYWRVNPKQLTSMDKVFSQDPLCQHFEYLVCLGSHVNQTNDPKVEPTSFVSSVQVLIASESCVRRNYAWRRFRASKQPPAFLEVTLWFHTEGCKRKFGLQETSATGEVVRLTARAVVVELCSRSMFLNWKVAQGARSHYISAASTTNTIAITWHSTAKVALLFGNNLEQLYYARMDIALCLGCCIFEFVERILVVHGILG